MIVGKAVRMAELMNVPVLGLVENMSYFECPDCGEKHEIFGKSHVEETAKQYGIPVVAKMPIEPKLAAGVDAGMTELFEGDYLDALFASLEG
jgi:Mrp family chromosome partitioning ATPase